MTSEWLAEMYPEGGIEDNNGQYVFESGKDIKLFCTLTEAGLNEGLTTRDLRFQTPSGDIVKPNATSNNITVSLVIVNATAPDSGQYNCGNISSGERFSMLRAMALEIGCKMHFPFDGFFCLSSY